MTVLKRALVLAAGDTEERFIQEALGGHFWPPGPDLAPTLLITKRVKCGGGFRGGVTGFGKFVNDARRLPGSSGGALDARIVQCMAERLGGVCARLLNRA